MTNKQKFDKASKLLAGGDVSAAEQIAEELLKDNAERDGHFLLGNCRMEEARYPEALAEFGNVLKIRPKDVDALFNSAVCRMLMTDFREAAENFSAVLQLQPDAKDALLRRASCYYASGRYQEALKDSERLLSLGYEDGSVFYGIALCKISLGEGDQAERYFRKSLIAYEEASKDGMLAEEDLERLSDCYGETGELERGISFFSDLIESESSSWILYQLRGWLYLEQEEYLNAEKDLETALRFNDQAIFAMCGLASIYSESNRSKAAEELLQRAREIDPTDIKAVEYLGVVYDQQGEYQKAVSLYQEVLQYTPKDPWIYYTLSKAYIHLKQIEQAEDALLKVLELDPCYPGIYIALGSLYAELSEHDKAIETFLKSEDSSDKFYQIAYSCYSLERYQEALEFAEKALEHSSEDPEIYRLLGFVFAELDLIKEAEENLQRYVLGLAKETSNFAEVPELAELFEWLRQDDRFKGLLDQIERMVVN